MQISYESTRTKTTTLALLFVYNNCQRFLHTNTHTIYTHYIHIPLHQISIYICIYIYIYIKLVHVSPVSSSRLKSENINTKKKTQCSIFKVNDIIQRIYLRAYSVQIRVQIEEYMYVIYQRKSRSNDSERATIVFQA